MIGHTAFDDLPAGLMAEIESQDLDVRTLYGAVVAAFAEDAPEGDVTSAATIDPASVAVGDIIARADGVLAGIAVAELVFCYAVPGVTVTRHRTDAERITRDEVVMSVAGPTASLLGAERIALNLLCHLSGVASATAAWVAAVTGTGARVRDTRKTLPGYRLLDKYAVRCGGGLNHRGSLSDQALIKDNHVLAAGGVVAAYAAVRGRYPDLPVQVEVTTLDQLAELLEVGAEQVLLDNMDLDQLRAAVALTAGRATLEASGGLSLERARAVAETGVDLLAVGALTHSAPVLDLALDLRAG